MNCSDSQIPRNKSLQKKTHDSCLGSHINAASRKSLEVQAKTIVKPRIHWERKVVSAIVFSCSRLINHESKTSGGLKECSLNLSGV